MVFINPGAIGDRVRLCKCVASAQHNMLLLLLLLMEGALPPLCVVKKQHLDSYFPR
jgi:hypothetical protein